MFVPILIGGVAVVGGILGFAASRPGAFRYQRTARIDAPPDRVFAKINDFHHWPSWSPWEELDPAMNRTHSGPASGKGAVYEWSGNKQVGQGRMEITESVPPEKVGIKLDFLKPFEAHNQVEITAVPSGNGSEVTWAMSGEYPFMMKVMCLFMNMEKMIARDFDKGLVRLKKLVEG